MRWHVAHSPQKSSFIRSQLAACANMRASVNFPTPRGPVKSKACGTRPLRSAPRNASTMRSLPRNSEKPISCRPSSPTERAAAKRPRQLLWQCLPGHARSEEHTSELQLLRHLVCRLLLEKKKKKTKNKSAE